MNNKGMTFLGFLVFLIILVGIGFVIYIYGFGFKKNLKVNKDSVGAINYGKIKNAELTVTSYISEIERINMLSEMDPVNNKKIETTDDIKKLNVVIRGQMPESGSIVVKDNIVVSANLIVDGFNCIYDGAEANCK